MLVNILNEILESSLHIHRDLANGNWLLPLDILKDLKRFEPRLGSPSRVVMANDSCAIYYTYVKAMKWGQGLRYEFQEHIIMCFPGDTEPTFLRGVKTLTKCENRKMSPDIMDAFLRRVALEVDDYEYFSTKTEFESHLLNFHPQDLKVEYMEGEGAIVKSMVTPPEKNPYSLRVHLHRDTAKFI